MKYHIIAVFVIWLVLGIGLAAAGTLTVTLDPSLDGNGTIKATSITKAVLSSVDGALPDGSFAVHRGGYGVKFNTAYKNATIINGTAKFYFGRGDVSGGYYSGSLLEGASVVRINALNDDLIPTRIDDPTKDIHQYVGEKLRVSVIGNLSDPTYRIETFSIGQGKNPAVMCTDGTGVGFDNIYIILSLKTNPQELEINALRDELEMSQPGNFSGNILIISAERITNYTPTAPTHPNTSTSINPSFSKWAFGNESHGDDYGGNDSKCSSCHGNLDTKPASFSEITINSGFCYRCHYGKTGAGAGFAGQVGCMHPHATTTSTSIPTLTSTLKQSPSTTTTPATPAFEAVSAIAALFIILRLVRLKL